MLEFRTATAAEVTGIAAMIRARGQWMVDRGIAGGDGWRDKADGLAEQAADPQIPMWVLTDDGCVVGCTCLYGTESVPAWLWTDERERAEPSLFLATSVTDPAGRGRGLGCLMVWSALDIAARRGLLWVRRGTGPFPGLVRYYTEVQGFEVVRTGELGGRTGYGLQRRASRQPALPGWLAAGAIPDGDLRSTSRATPTSTPVRWSAGTVSTPG